MRILVYPHDLGIGGSQINAIELAERVQRAGHEVIVYGTPGPLVDRINELGLEFVVASEPRRRPDHRIVRQLRRLAVDREIDILHGYEWPPALECFLASEAREGTRPVATVMSMAVAPFIPRTMPLVVGTRQIEAAERASGRERVFTIEPPVDLELNSPTIEVGGAQFRAEWGVEPGAISLVAVTRLAREMKLEGLLAAMRGLVELNRERPVDLLIVGDGPARRDVEEGAYSANAAIGRPAIRLTGELVDPRPAYAASDIQLAMGSSALRALAFGKPTVVQGERGFWRLVDEQSLDYFRWAGWYGVGDSAVVGTERFLSEIRPVIDSPDLRRRLGTFGRTVTRSLFSLDAAAVAQSTIYYKAHNYPSGTSLREAMRSVIDLGHYKTGRLAQRVLGRAPRDDFNSKPVAVTGPAIQREVDKDAGDSLWLGAPTRLEQGGEALAERLAIIVVTHNSARHLPNLLGSLSAGCDGVDWTLVVVDNASTDGSLSVLEQANVAQSIVVQSGGNLGYAAGINLGVLNCPPGTTSFLILNPDIELQPQSARALLRGLRSPGVGVAVPQTLNSSGAPVRSVRRRPSVSRAFGEALLGPIRAGRFPRWGDLVTDPNEYLTEHDVAWAEGSAQLISADCWRACGRWDESFFLYSEETEYHLRVQDHGFSVRFVPDAQVVHHKGESTTNPKLWSLLMANRVHLFRQRHGVLQTVSYWLACVLREARRSLMGHATSRRALVTLMNPSLMRRPRSSEWIK